MMYNISFIDFGVTDEPVEVDETYLRQGRCISVYFWEGFGVVLSPS